MMVVSRSNIQRSHISQQTVASRRRLGVDILDDITEAWPGRLSLGRLSQQVSMILAGRWR